MSVDYKCRQIYNDVIHDVTKTEETWKSVLSLCGRIYRYVIIPGFRRTPSAIQPTLTAFQPI